MFRLVALGLVLAGVLNSGCVAGLRNIHADGEDVGIASFGICQSVYSVGEKGVEDTFRVVAKAEAGCLLTADHTPGWIVDVEAGVKFPLTLPDQGRNHWWAGGGLQAAILHGELDDGSARSLAGGMVIARFGYSKRYPLGSCVGYAWLDPNIGIGVGRFEKVGLSYHIELELAGLQF